MDAAGLAGVGGVVERQCGGEVRQCEKSGSVKGMQRDGWSGWADSNCRSPAPKAGALPLGHTPTPRRARVIRRRAATSRGRRRPASVEQVPPRRLELRSLAPEASTLSTELQGHLKCYHSGGVSRQFILATLLNRYRTVESGQRQTGVAVTDDSLKAALACQLAHGNIAGKVNPSVGRRRLHPHTGRFAGQRSRNAAVGGSESVFRPLVNSPWNRIAPLKDWRLNSHSPFSTLIFPLAV